MSDEFEKGRLDMDRWSLGLAPWKGRQPGLFSDKNVSISDGRLHLTMRKEKVPEQFEKLGYKEYTSAALHTKAKTAYGYVDGQDFLAWKRGYGMIGTATLSDGDANNDQDVDANDLTTWEGQLGSTPANTTLAATTVPEPSSVCLFLLSASALFAKQVGCHSLQLGIAQSQVHGT